VQDINEDKEPWALELPNVIGMDYAKNKIGELLMPLDKEIYDELISNKMRIAGGILLYGVPGTGKTHMLDEIYNTYKSKDVLFRKVSFSSIAGSNVGDADKLLKELFKKINSSPKLNILFFDEIDALFPSRDTTQSVLTKERISSFLELTGSKSSANILMIGTTNRISKIDKAIRRALRFRDAIKVDMPDCHELYLMCMMYFKGFEFIDTTLELVCMAVSRHGVTDLISTNGLTGADIYSLSLDLKKQSIYCKKKGLEYRFTSQVMTTFITKYLNQKKTNKEYEELYTDEYNNM